MSRRYHDPIAVTVHPTDGLPVAFTWRGVTFAVQAIGRWRLRSYWWDPTRATQRLYYRVCTADYQVFDIYRDTATGAWVLDVVHD